MAVFRVEKNTNYTTMSNIHLRDTRLSLKAIGLLSKILSLPEDWDYTIPGLAAICKEGKDAIRSALEELEATGYIERRQTHAPDGSFAGNEYIVHEEPICAEIAPLSGNPSTGNPLTGNPPELNKDIPSIDLNNPPTPQTGEGEPAETDDEPEKSKPKWKPERFEAFWDYYGYKVGRKKAVRAWDRLKPSDKLLAIMGRALEIQKASPQWTKDGGQYRPHPSTWLNGAGWEDDLQAAPPLPDNRGGYEQWN